MPNPWRKGPLTVNPYYRTAFRALGIERDAAWLARDAAWRADLGERVQSRGRVVKHKPGHLRLGEQPLTLADVTDAGKTLADPTGSILEELLEHQKEDLPTDEIERLAARLPRPDWPERVPEPRHLTFLLRAVPDLLQAFLEDGMPVDVPAYPVDTDLIPPFSLSEEDHHGGSWH
jgi:hypothetical protein